VRSPGRPGDGAGRAMVTPGSPGPGTTLTGGSAASATIGRVRVAIVTESFLPALNGVTTSVLKVLESLRDRGHDALVVAPGTTPWAPELPPERYAGFPVHTVTSVPVRQFRVGLPSYEMETVLHRYAPDVVHAASPFVLGVRGLTAARALGIPSVAVYQTDMPSYIRQHSGPAGRLTSRAAWRWIRRIHAQADLTLAPSRAALEDLRAHDIQRVALWGRGVDAERFHPGLRQDPATQRLRERLAPDGELLLGYVGRLAPEKELHRLAELADLPGTRLVLVGGGPAGTELRRALRGAAFLGRRDGPDLARCYAAFDLFVHTGTRETFGQTLQEASAAGLPVVAPRRGGPVDLVAEGVTGLLFDPDRPGALRQAVSGLVGDGAPADLDRLRRMGLAGRSQVGERSWPALVDQLLGHYAAAMRTASVSVA
jgi:phosphatidylinositol alpha 1,6-mannosyltransferase